MPASGAFTLARRGKRFELRLDGLERGWSFAKEPVLEAGVKRLGFLIGAPPSRPPPALRGEEAGRWAFIPKDGFASPEESLAHGKLHVLLESERLHGEAIFVETKKGWLFYAGGPPPSPPRG